MLFIKLSLLVVLLLTMFIYLYISTLYFCYRAKMSSKDFSQDLYDIPVAVDFHVWCVSVEIAEIKFTLQGLEKLLSKRGFEFSVFGVSFSLTHSQIGV